MPMRWAVGAKDKAGSGVLRTRKTGDWVAWRDKGKRSIQAREVVYSPMEESKRKKK